METIEVRSKSYVIKWVNALENSVVHYEIKPLKKSINFAVYTYRDGEAPFRQETPGDVAAVHGEQNGSGSALGRHRSGTVNSATTDNLPLETKLENAKLVKRDDLGRLNGDESYTGEIVVAQSNVFAFVFDNTFSKTTGKKVLFTQYADDDLEIHKAATGGAQAAAPVPAPVPVHAPYENSRAASSTSSFASAKAQPAQAPQQQQQQAQQMHQVHQVPGIQRSTTIKFDLDAEQELQVRGGKYLQGFLLKKKRKKTGKNFNKRFFVLNFKYGVLNYYLNDKSKHVRGNMFIRYVGITADPKSRVIVLDSGLEIWTLKAMSDDDLHGWVSAFNRIKREDHLESGAGAGAGAPHRTAAPDEREADDFSVNDDATQDLIRDLEVLQLKIEDLKLKSEGLSKSLNADRSLSRKASVSSISTQQRRPSFWSRRRTRSDSASQRDAASSAEGSPVLPNSLAPIPEPVRPATAAGAAAAAPSPASESRQLHDQLVEANNMVLQLINQQQFRLRHGDTAGGPGKYPLSRGSTVTTAANSIFSQEFYDANEYVNELNSGVLMINHDDSDAMLSRDDLHKDVDVRTTTVEEADEADHSSDADGRDSASTSDDDGGDGGDADTTFTDSPAAAAGSPAEHHVDLYPLSEIAGGVARRTDIRPSAGPPPSILAFVRKNIGKDLSTVSMPVTANEPLTALQKYAEMFEYAALLNALPAADVRDGERILKVAVFATAYLSSLRVKERNNRKPFNPLLGETYELVREDLGLRAVMEKVVHRPQVFALYADAADWTLQYAASPDQKFWSKSAEIVSKGTVKLTLRSTGEVYQWSQPTTLLKNIIAGEKYVEPSSSITVVSSTGHRAVVEYKPGGMFSGRSEELTIRATDAQNNPLPLQVTGTWTEKLVLKRPQGVEETVWEAGDLVANSVKKYGFTKFAASLNEITSIEAGKLSPTDSRLRPDLQNYEDGNLDEAETLKLQLELDQRNRRNQGVVFEPAFFKKVSDDRYDFVQGDNSYWERRRRSDWSGLLQLW